MGDFGACCGLFLSCWQKNALCDLCPGWKRILEACHLKAPTRSSPQQPHTLGAHATKLCAHGIPTGGRAPGPPCFPACGSSTKERAPPRPGVPPTPLCHPNTPQGCGLPLPPRGRHCVGWGVARKVASSDTCFFSPSKLAWFPACCARLQRPDRGTMFTPACVCVVRCPAVCGPVRCPLRRRAPPSHRLR